MNLKVKQCFSLTSYIRSKTVFFYEQSIIIFIKKAEIFLCFFNENNTIRIQGFDRIDPY